MLTKNLVEGVSESSSKSRIGARAGLSRASGGGPAAAIYRLFERGAQFLWLRLPLSPRHDKKQLLNFQATGTLAPAVAYSHILPTEGEMWGTRVRGDIDLEPPVRCLRTSRA
jgi:hypothetical protein